MHIEVNELDPRATLMDLEAYVEGRTEAIRIFQDYCTQGLGLTLTTKLPVGLWNRIFDTVIQEAARYLQKQHQDRLAN